MRNLKKLGLVALATLALSGLWVASASAQKAEFVASSYPSKITGTQVSEQLESRVELNGHTGYCNTSLAGEITKASNTVALELSGYCESFGIKNSFKMNGCKIELNPGWNAAGFGPSGCGPITLQIFTCSATIPAQNGLFTTYANAEGGVPVSLNTETVRYSGGCGAGENGDFFTTWNLTGVSLNYPFEESLFAAEKSPATLVGSSETAYGNTFTTEAGTVECKGATYSGTASGTHAQSLSPTFTECRAFGFLSATVATNGCQFVYHTEEEGAGENFPFDVSCPLGNTITVTASTCAVSIGSQTGDKAVNYQNIASSPTQRSKYKILNSVTNLTYTVTKDGIGCPFNGLGTRTTGKFTGNTVVEGRNAEGRPLNIKIGA